MTKDELQEMRDMCKRNGTKFPSDVMKLVIDELEQAYAEIERLKNQDQLYGQMYDSLGNELAKMKEENSQLRQTVHDIWFLADIGDEDRPLTTIAKITLEARKALER